MRSRLETPLTLAGALAAIVAGVLAALYWQQQAAPESAVATAPAATWDWLVVPGMSRVDTPSPGLIPEPAPEPGLALDPDGHLVAGLALRRLIDSYLARGPAETRAERVRQLLDFLNHRLAAAAAAEGARIVGRYSQYLDTQERLLARERFEAFATRPLSERDVERLLDYREQRAQLRERVLGAKLARAWFEADDSRCVAALREWQLQHVAPEAGQELDPIEIRERRIHGAALEARRNEDAQVCAAQMIRADGGG
jgi:hypothetical protein